MSHGAERDEKKEKGVPWWCGTMDVMARDDILVRRRSENDDGGLIRWERKRAGDLNKISTR